MADEPLREFTQTQRGLATKQLNVPLLNCKRATESANRNNSNNIAEAKEEQLGSNVFAAFPRAESPQRNRTVQQRLDYHRPEMTVVLKNDSRVEYSNSSIIGQFTTTEVGH